MTETRAGSVRPKIYVGPGPIDELSAAVEAGGGKAVADMSEAEAAIWYGGSPAAFAAADHPGLRWVQLPSAGVESWVGSGALRADAVFTSAAGSYARTCAEHALTLLLAGLRQVHELARRTEWGPALSTSLFGAKVAIVGCGGIGRALIELLAPFEVEVLAITRSGTAVPGTVSTDTPDRLHAVLAAADHVVLAAPATTRTRHLIGAAELELMGPDAWLINVARGGLVDTDALVAALEAGTIGGAALDVTEPEPLPAGHRLWSQERALITPHSANPSHLHLARLVERVTENVRRFVEGEPLLGVIDLAHGY